MYEKNRSRAVGFVVEKRHNISVMTKLGEAQFIEFLVINYNNLVNYYMYKNLVLYKNLYCNTNGENVAP